ncbi:MAG: homoserine dehydrogenase [Chloroflexi bacterium]|nr:homoserine dehydrogenase [Chloroflexota bacterium]
MHITVALIGFGNVGRALARLLMRKTDVLRQDYNLTFTVTGIATNSRGCAIDPGGIHLETALKLVEAGDGLRSLHRGDPVIETLDFIERCPASLILESTWLNPHTGQPAADYARAALRAGRHVVTANKGPVAFAYRELCELARQNGRGFFFESTVMDGAPVLGLGREALLATDIHRIHGILNSTTNFVLTQIEEGSSLEQAVQQAQQMGLAEADPANDLEGWDAAVKIVVLANVLMGADLRPADVDRTGITGLAVDDIRAAVASGERYKLLCEAVREGETVRACVRPVRLPLSDPLSQIRGTSSAVTFETDTLSHLTLIEGDPDPETTAYGMLVDMINITRERYL